LSHELLFADAQALTGGGDDAARINAVRDARHRAAPQNAPVIGIELATGERLARLHPAWQDQCTRADAINIFMNPVLVALAGQAYPVRQCCAVLAWQSDDAAAPRLLGIWAFAIGRAPYSAIPSPMLCAPPMPNAYLSTPVVDRNSLDAVLAAMIEHIAGNNNVPKIIALDAMGADTETMKALVRVLQARGTAPFIFSQARRPHLASALDGKAYLEQAFSSSSRKKLRQHRRRLAEKGELKSTIVSESAVVDKAFDDFMTLEASGWKGHEDTALLNNSADAKYSRAMIGALAAKGDAAIHMLTLNGRAISMQMVLRAGASAFTWKTAYDESLHDFSPGTLLLEDYTMALLADPKVTDVDSCSFDDTGYMAAWTERAGISNLWFDTRRGGSLSFSILSRAQAGFLALRHRAKAIYHDLQRLKARPKKTH
jgi:hypothetical protein